MRQEAHADLQRFIILSQMHNACCKECLSMQVTKPSMFTRARNAFEGITTRSAGVKASDLAEPPAVQEPVKKGPKLKEKKTTASQKK